MSERVKILREKHGHPSDRTQKKVINYLTNDVQSFIKRSPFAVISTSDKNGNCDASPRGGQPGFVKILNSTTLLMPDVRGNRLLQSTSNLEENPKAGLLFLIPGDNKSVRVNGQVEFLDMDEIQQLGIRNELYHPDETSEMIQGLKITIHEAYHHCPRALSFSDLWNTDTIKRNRSENN
jgi:PPOX class probable FMN-dependent enzyme